jgi:hypothetical protein
MAVVAFGLSGAGLLIVLMAVLVRVTWVTRHRPREESITEEQARENSAPLTTAIVSRTAASAMGSEPGRMDPAGG